jgi:hypothetical protein
LANILVNIDVVIVPTQAVRDCRADEHAGKKSSCRTVIHRVGIRIDDGCRCGLLDDDNRRIILRHVYNFRIWRLDDDRLLFLDNDLLVVRYQVACSVGARADLLDRIHDVFLLADNRSAELPGPVKIIVHRLDHLGIVEKAKNARIPILARFQLGVFVSLLKKTGGLDNLQRIGRGWKHDRNKLVRIKGDSPHEFIQFFRRQCLRSIGCGVAGRWRLSPYRAQRHTRHQQYKRSQANKSFHGVTSSLHLRRPLPDPITALPWLFFCGRVCQKDTFPWWKMDGSRFPHLDFGQPGMIQPP